MIRVNFITSNTDILISYLLRDHLIVYKLLTKEHSQLLIDFTNEQKKTF